MAEKILIIDDDVVSVEIMKVFLSRQGYQVVTAGGGDMGLDMARREQPDLIILDVMMPGLDGFEVARRLHNLAETTHIPILMVTALRTYGDKEKGYEAGVDIYLTKPLHRMDFQANVRSLLLQHRAKSVVYSSQGYLVGVLAARGGLGVSTAALNLAVSCAAWLPATATGEPIAAELQAGHGVWADELGMTNNQALDALLALDPFGISPSVIEPLLLTDHGIRLLLASSGAAVNSSDKSLVHYDSILMALRALSPLVVLDAGTHFSPAFGSVLTQCNELVVLTEPHPEGVRHAARLIETLRAHAFGSVKPLSVVTVNHIRPDAGMTLGQVEKALDCPVTLGIPPAFDLTSLAWNQKRPVSTVQTDSLLSRQFDSLAEHVKVHMGHHATGLVQP